MSADLTQGVYGAIIGFTLGILFYNILLPYLIRLKFGQEIRNDGPQSHLSKQGTPTMGGVIFLSTLIVTTLFFLNGDSDILAILLLTIGYGVIGFIDDYIKVVKKRSLGLKAMQKIVGQLIITTMFLYYLLVTKENLGAIYIPFGNGNVLDLGILYFPFFYIVMIGTVNSVNLTDGLDGLASGVSILVSIFFGFAALTLNSNLYIVCWILGGALSAFLLFNSNPAKIFMGDTGSLALGGFIAGVSITLGLELFILIVGIVYVVESLSVIIQVTYFKKTGGKRIFKMAPFHHHLELSGYKEQKIVQTFYILTGIACLFGYLAVQNIG